MRWVAVIWSMGVGACLTLALMQTVVWRNDRTARANLAFAVLAVSVAVFGAFELGLMRAKTTEQLGFLVRWLHVPLWVMVASLVVFVRFYLRAGWRWLAWTIVVVRTASLILNFVFWPNLNYREITALQHISFLGESVSVPKGVPNPWALVAQLSLLLLVIFVLDATITAWRRGDRRQALMVGGSILFFVVAGAVQGSAIVWWNVSMPVTVSLFYQGMVAVMAYELSYDVLHAATLSRQLQATQAGLRESEARIKLAANAANLGLWIWDIPGDERWATEKWRQLFGFVDSEPVTLDRFLQMVHPGDRERVKQVVQHVLEHGGEYEIEYRITRPDGSKRWILGHGSVELDERGKPTLARGVARDITKRKIAEEELRESEGRFRTVADAAPVMIWISGTDKLCTFFNKPWLAFTGRTIEQEMGNGWAHGVHPDDLQRCLKTYTEAFDARQPFVMQYRLRRHDGEYRWISDDGVPLYDSQKNFAGYIGSCIDVTELLKNEEALREFEERVRLAAEAAHLGVWELDTATDEMWMSESARILFQFDPQTRVSHAALQDRIHPEDRALRDSAVKRAIETDGEYETEYRVLLPDGTLRWIGGRGRCVAGQNGKRARLIGVSMDITSQKQTQELFRLATEASPSGMLLVNEQGRIVLVNAHIEELFGYRRDELVGKLIETLVPERFVAGHPVHRARFFASPEPRALGAGRDLFARRKDGTEFPVEIAVNPVRTAEGILVLATVIDITERKQAEEKFRLAVEASPSGILLVNQTGQIVLVNSKIEELFRYRREELIGQSVEILVPERFASEHPTHRRTFFAAPATRAMGAGRELFARRKDGSEFRVEIGLNPIRTADGIAVLANVVDISARLEAEEEARRHRQQVELFSRASLLGEMTASLAHELSQPLGAIINNASAALEYIEQDRLDPTQLQEILTDVIGDGRRAFDIISNVRNAIKKGSTIRGQINLNDVVKTVTHMVYPDAIAHFCTLEMSLARDLPGVQGDPTQIQQVLLNLVRNAFDGMRDMPPSRRVVEISTNYNGDGTVSVAVRDHGCGISEKTPERLFEQFFTTKEEGLGMGLAIVRSIVEAHGGTIAAENADGGGARFHFRLPASEAMPQ